MAESEKKLSAREEELKNNTIDLVARSEELEKAKAEIGLLKGELTRLHEESRLLKLQLEEAKAAAANVVSEYQSLEEMHALKQTLHDEGYEEAMEAFAYTATTTHLKWDQAFLSEHLVDQNAEWHAALRANQPPVDKCPTRPPSPVTEPPVIPPPPEQVIGGDQEPVARAAESDGSVEQIDNPDDVLNRQEE